MKQSGSFERRSTPKNVMNRRSTNKTPTGVLNSEQRPSGAAASNSVTGSNQVLVKNSKLAEINGVKTSFLEHKSKISDLQKNAMYIKKLNVQGQPGVPFVGRHGYQSSGGSTMGMMSQNYP